MLVSSVLYVEPARDTHGLLFNFTGYAFFPLHSKKGLIVSLKYYFTDFEHVYPGISMGIFGGAVKSNG